MLSLLNISNIALIDELRVEFGRGLNLLTGETGSGKSIIVDALGILIGGRFTSDLLKTGAERGFIEGLFSVTPSPPLQAALAAAGIEVETGNEEATAETDIIIRRELSAPGRNKIFINNQLATQSLLRELRPFLVDIHGQGDQQTLFSPETHLELLDAFTANAARLAEVDEAYHYWLGRKRELDQLQRDEAERFQLVDILKFQITELERAQLAIGEDATLEEERRLLLNFEKLTALSDESYRLIYDDNEAALTRLRQAMKRVAELAEFDSTFAEYKEGLEAASAVLEDLAFSLRGFSDKLEFSPARLAEIEDRLVEISRLKRKYGGSIENSLEHLARSEDRLRQVEHSAERELQLRAELSAARLSYLERAGKLHTDRVRAAKKFEQAVERGLAEVAMESARFQVHINAPTAAALSDETTSSSFTVRGIDQVEFYFSANVGEDVKPLAKVASGGEASRLMLVLKTVANASEFPRTIVFDEIDTGIGGRVSEAVGVKLKKLAQSNQVLCVTHQPQIARFADNHLLVQKQVVRGQTRIEVAQLDRQAQIEELARMLTGAEITASARRHAKELLKG
ncbi:MAG: DNA repair protein RecN [Pyrinomonadaceae bacterium]|nr:DNA repair protein RecN [Pyrinomonadaceae bacterium]